LKNQRVTEAIDRAFAELNQNGIVALQATGLTESSMSTRCMMSVRMAPVG